MLIAEELYQPMFGFVVVNKLALKAAYLYSSKRISHTVLFHEL
jgi:hypothetical protein